MDNLRSWWVAVRQLELRIHIQSIKKGTVFSVRTTCWVLNSFRISSPNTFATSSLCNVVSDYFLNFLRQTILHHIHFTLWLVSSVEVRKDPGPSFFLQLFLSFFMWTAECNMIEVFQERLKMWLVLSISEWHLFSLLSVMVSYLSHLPE